MHLLLYPRLIPNIMLNRPLILSKLRLNYCQNTFVFFKELLPI